MTPAASALVTVCGAMAIFGALTVALAKSALRAAMGLLVHVIALSGLYLTLHAELLAVLQLLVYAGAVTVLFVFVIMMIGPMMTARDDDSLIVSRTTTGVLITVFFTLIASVVSQVSLVWPTVAASFGSVQGLGTEFYTRSAVPFEIVSVTLLIAVTGSIAVARGRRAPKKSAKE